MPSNADDGPGRFVKKTAGKEPEGRGYPRQPLDGTTDYELVTGDDAPFDPGPGFEEQRETEAAYTEEALGMYGATPSRRATIIHGRHTVDGGQKNEWPVVAYDGTEFDAVKNVPGADPGIDAVYDSDGVIWIGIPGVVGTYAKRTEVVADFPNINLRTAIRRFIEAGGPAA